MTAVSERMNSQRTGGIGLILDKILMTLYCRDTSSPMTPIYTSANHPTNDLCSAETTTLGFCCFLHKQKVSIMIKCSATCAVMFFLGHCCDDEFYQRAIYSSHLNSREGLLAKLAAGEYSWPSTGTHPPTVSLP